MTISSEQFARLTLEDMIAGVEKGEFTSADLAAAAIGRMDVFEPSINAVITRNDEALLAGAAGHRPDGRALDGVPVAVKDNIMTRGLRSTCGSRILGNFIPPYDACVVEKLRDAGALVSAKVNMDEFAMGVTGETSGYGPARNPWDTGRVAGGSSSGSAAIVGYGGAPAALASDTGGSIRQPASYCGVVGMKPTYGRVSRYGLGSLASSLDQIGPITRTVRDNALMLDILSGHDGRDSTSSAMADTAAPCLPAIEDGIKGLRIGWDPAIMDREGMASGQLDALRRTVDVCRSAGAELVDITVPLLDYGVAAYYIICCCEASANMARYDGIRYGVRQGGGDLWDVYAETRGQGFGDEVKRRIMMGSYALSTGYYDAFYLKAARVRRLFTLEFNKIFEKVDAILMPVTAQPPRALNSSTSPLDDYLCDIFTIPANLTSLPALSFPVATYDGLPASAQVMAGAFREDILYRIARTAEKSSALSGQPWLRSAPEERS